jgi:SulP family sulfate permease
VVILVFRATLVWISLQPGTLKPMPLGETAVMIVTVACVVPPTPWQPVSARLLVSIVIFSKRAACVADISGGRPSAHRSEIPQTQPR